MADVARWRTLAEFRATFISAYGKNKKLQTINVNGNNCEINGSLKTCNEKVLEKSNFVML